MTEPTIALSGSGLAITFPSDISGRTHTIQVPLNLGGLQIIHKALMARQREADRRIGNASSPTQSMVEKWLATERAEMAKKPLVVNGVDFSNIDLDL